MFEGSDIDYLGPFILYIASVATFSFFVMIKEGIDREWYTSEGRKTWIFLTFHSWPVLGAIFIISLAYTMTDLAILLRIGEIVALTYPLSFGMYELSNHSERTNERKINQLEFEINDLKRRLN